MVYCLGLDPCTCSSRVNPRIYKQFYRIDFSSSYASIISLSGFLFSSPESMVFSHAILTHTSHECICIQDQAKGVHRKKQRKKEKLDVPISQSLKHTVGSCCHNYCYQKFCILLMEQELKGFSPSSLSQC